MDANGLASYMIAFLNEDEADDPQFSNYVEDWNPSSVRMDGLFNFVALAEAVLEAIGEDA